MMMMSTLPLEECNVINCVFRRCGSINDDEWVPDHPIIIYFEFQKENFKLKCIGNVFEDCVTHPIIEDSGVDDFDDLSYGCVDNFDEWYILKGHVLKGNNMFKGRLFDANKVYEM